MTRRGYTFNICGFIRGDRIMKETITATDRAQARAVARELLRRRGFNPAQVRLEVIPITGSLTPFL